MKKVRIPLRDRLCFVLGLTEAYAQAVMDGSADIDLESVEAGERLDPPTLERILKYPWTVNDIRLDPNRVTRAQFGRLPGVTPEQAGVIDDGRPYYSMAELQAATNLSPAVLSELFVIPPLRLVDKPAGRDIRLDPAPGRYIVPAPAEFEANTALANQFRTVHSWSGALDWRIIEAEDFEDARPVLGLKRALRGQVHPVLRDAQGFERYVVPGSLDLWFRRESPEVRRQAVIRELGLVVTDARPRVGFYRVRLASPPADGNVILATLDVIARAQTLGEVTLAELDQVGFHDFGPDISAPAGAVSDYEAIDLFWNHDVIELAAAHKITTGSDKVTIIVVDCGTRMAHQDLAAAFRPDWPGLDLNFDLDVPESELSPNELVRSHGTQVAGVAGGRGTDVAGAHGIAPGCRILPVKIPGQSGGPATPGYGLRAAAILQALSYLAPAERAVLNLSWRTNGEHIGIREALREAEKRDVAIVTSAGNYTPGAVQMPDEIHYPSAHAYLEPTIRGMCAVAAVAFGDRKASYSYYGRQSVAVAAQGGEPGEAGSAIYTASTPTQYGYVAGTSFAAPHVAGLIALLFSLRPSLSATEAIEIIRQTADSVDSTDPTYAEMLGAGRINVRAALERLQGEASPGLPAPVPSIIPAPSQSEPETPAGGHPQPLPGSDVGAGRPLNINRAALDELLALPLVGPWRAAQIIAYRAADGPLSSIWSLALTGAFDPWSIRQLAPLIAV